MENNAKRNVTLSIIGVALLVVAVVGVSFAFFSYVYTGGNTSTVNTGTILFEASDTKMELTNVFPTTSAATDKVATVMVEGTTSYEAGIEFVVTAGTVTNAGSAKGIVPTIVVEAETGIAGLTLSDVYDAATDGALTGNTVLARGIIKPATAGETVTIAADTKILTIKAFYDINKYHISKNTKTELVNAGLLSDSFPEAGIINPTDWNAMSNPGPAYSFTINVVATQANSGRPASANQGD